MLESVDHLFSIYRFVSPSLFFGGLQSKASVSEDWHPYRKSSAAKRRRRARKSTSLLCVNEERCSLLLSSSLFFLSFSFCLSFRTPVSLKRRCTRLSRTCKLPSLVCLYCCRGKSSHGGISALTHSSSSSSSSWLPTSVFPLSFFSRAASVPASRTG